MQSKPIQTDAVLLALIEKAKAHVMTAEEKAAQRKSWVIGEFMIEHPEATREYAESVYAKVNGAELEKTKAREPFTEILPDDDHDAGIHLGDFSTAISVWSFMQNSEKPQTVAEVSLAFNTTPELVRRAVTEHYWLFLSPENEADPTKQFIEHEGE